MNLRHFLLKYNWIAYYYLKICAQLSRFNGWLRRRKLTGERLVLLRLRLGIAALTPAEKAIIDQTWVGVMLDWYDSFNARVRRYSALYNHVRILESEVVRRQMDAHQIGHMSQPRWSPDEEPDPSPATTFSKQTTITTQDHRLEINIEASSLALEDDLRDFLLDATGRYFGEWLDQQIMNGNGKNHFRGVLMLPNQNDTSGGLFSRNYADEDQYLAALTRKTLSRLHMAYRSRRDQVKWFVGTESDFFDDMSEYMGMPVVHVPVLTGTGTHLVGNLAEAYVVMINPFGFEIKRKAWHGFRLTFIGRYYTGGEVLNPQAVSIGQTEY